MSYKAADVLNGSSVGGGMCEGVVGLFCDLFMHSSPAGGLLWSVELKSWEVSKAKNQTEGSLPQVFMNGDNLRVRIPTPLSPPQPVPQKCLV